MKFSLDSATWSQSTEDQNKPLGELVQKMCANRQLDSKSFLYWEMQLPFYDDSVTLICLEFEILKGRAEYIYYLRTWDEELRDTSYHFLNGISAPIHKVNDSNGIKVTAGNAIDFLYFFGFFVHSGDGPFYALTKPDDERVPSKIWNGESDIPTLEFEPLTKYFRPPCLREQTNVEEERYHLSALIYHGDTIFKADFFISGAGDINMSGDEMLVTGLPSVIEINLTP